LSDPISTDALPAASSAAADSTPAGSPALDIDAMSAEQLHDWRMTGKSSPDPKDSTPPDADPSPATADADQPASTDATSEPTSESATPALNAKTKARMDELLADRSRERERADRAEQRARDLEARHAPPPPSDARPAVSSTAPAADALVKPDPETFAYGTADPAYLEALTDYKVAATLQAERQKWDASQQAERQAETQRQTIAAFETRAAKAREKHADFDAVALLAPTEIPQGSPADLLILEHEHGAEILYHLQHADHAGERRRILAMKPLDQIVELVRLGDRLTQAPPAARSTSAPAPPAVLSTRATPADPVERAIAEDDTAAYNAAMNRRELAKLKGL